MAPTLRSLAEELGVHPSLISRVLRDDPGVRVSGEVRARVVELATKAGYRPNRVGRSFRTRETQILGMLTPDITNSFHSRLFRSVETVAAGAGVNIILSNTDDDPGRLRRIA